MEILEAVKAGGSQPSSASPTVKPSETTEQPSPQAHRKTTTGAKPQGNIMEALSSLGDNPTARLKKVDPEAEAKRKAAAESKLRSSGKVEKSGNLMGDLQGALAKRRGDIAGHHDGSEVDEDWND